jgi:hypothetical protein
MSEMPLLKSREKNKGVRLPAHTFQGQLIPLFLAHIFTDSEFII